MTVPAASAVLALTDDLAAEQESLDVILAGLAESEWSLPTPADGWDIRDQVAHLAFVDELAVQALLQPEEFTRTLEAANADQHRYEAAAAQRGRQRTGPQTLTWWREARAASIGALRGADLDARLPWFGPPMKLRSFVTARLMETWSHGQDVADAAGVLREPADRLAHIAHLGVATRGWSFACRGQPVPDTEIFVDLALPSGRRQQWGPPDAPSRISGPALDFCLVVTQRRHWTDVTLEVSGDDAAAWLEIAQAFAGPPTVCKPGRGLEA